MPALLYVAVSIASRSSFHELWTALWPIVKDREKLWTTCMRVKRGTRDTSQPGGYYKDQSTFNGAIRLLLARHEIDWKALHALKITLEDLSLGLPLAHDALIQGWVKLPSFLDPLDEYLVELDEIAAANGIT